MYYKLWCIRCMSEGSLLLNTKLRLFPYQLKVSDTIICMAFCLCQNVQMIMGVVLSALYYNILILDLTQKSKLKSIIIYLDCNAYPE